MLPQGLPRNPGELPVPSEQGSGSPEKNEPGPGGSLRTPVWERRSAQTRRPVDQGRPEAAGKGREQSYELMVPMKVGNRRAPARGGHGTHWRDGANKRTDR
jgi:hypothetical protein